MNTARTREFTIKICGITSASDAQLAVDNGANALGFNFYRQSPRYIQPAIASEIVKHINGNYLRVGVFVHATADELQRVGAEAGLDVLQLHGTLPTALPSGYRIWQAIAAGSDLVVHPRVERYLMDTPSAQFGGSGRTFEWQLARQSAARVILAGGLHADNVAEAIEVARPAGVDACSCLESAPGRKDPRRTINFIKAAWAAQQQLQQLELSV